MCSRARRSATKRGVPIPERHVTAKNAPGIDASTAPPMTSARDVRDAIQGAGKPAWPSHEVNSEQHFGGFRETQRYHGRHRKGRSRVRPVSRRAPPRGQKLGPKIRDGSEAQAVREPHRRYGDAADLKRLDSLRQGEVASYKEGPSKEDLPSCAVSHRVAPHDTPVDRQSEIASSGQQRRSLDDDDRSSPPAAARQNVMLEGFAYFWLSMEGRV